MCCAAHATLKRKLLQCGTNWNLILWVKGTSCKKGMHLIWSMDQNISFLHISLSLSLAAALVQLNCAAVLKISVCKWSLSAFSRCNPQVPHGEVPVLVPSSFGWIFYLICLFFVFGWVCLCSSAAIWYCIGRIGRVPLSHAHIFFELGQDNIRTQYQTRLEQTTWRKNLRGSN